jgi:hypothetical protein
MARPTRIQFLLFTIVGLIFALSVARFPASAEEVVQHLGPVGPFEPILTSVGPMRLVAFYVPVNGQCDLQVVMWQAYDSDAKTASSVRINLSLGQIAQFYSPEGKSVKLQCRQRDLALDDAG